MADNTITVIGNVTREPELRYTPGGQAKTDFGVAVNRSWIDKASNERKEQTSFLNVVAWGQLGENVASSLPKGSRVIVTGRLEQRTYETQGGEKRERIEIVADEIGPSLRWATAQIERNDRRGGETSGSFGGGRPAAAAPAADAAYHDNEEPF